MSQSVLISGGGIVGSFLGLELAAREIPFKIIEKKPFASSKNDHIRSLTLNLSASERLEDLGVKTESSLIKRMKIFDGSGSGKLSFNCDEANIDYLAKVFSFNDLREALIEKVESSVSIGNEITSFKAMESGIQAKLSNGSTLESDLLVIAEGRNSTLAKSIASEGFSKDYDPSIPLLYLDRHQIIQALINIVRNAIQAINKDGKVTIKTRPIFKYTIGDTRHDLVIKIDVIDNGVGIPEEKLKEIFYPMVTTKNDGMGLGLTIAQSIIFQNKGIIECKSKNKETIFSIILPWCNK